jgi:hypothetical protein
VLFSFPVCGCQTSEEGMMFDALLPKVFAVIAVLKVKLNRVFVVTLFIKNVKLFFWCYQLRSGKLQAFLVSTIIFKPNHLFEDLKNRIL